MATIFSGSYDADDVCFLLKPVKMDFTDVQEKEHRIQSGQNHYSEMLSEEHLPSAQYMRLFMQAMQRNAKTFAKHILQLSGIIADRAERRNADQITLVSLARAGTPVGVLLKRSLGLLGREARHYSLSIIRDRGIDEVALQHILEQDERSPQSLVFVDGWTGKGVIGAELRKAVNLFNARTGLAVPSDLHVVADLCGVAEVSATGEDYLIPSSLLNAIISGLVSRSVLNERLVGPQDFHACVYHEQWVKDDLSRWFVDTIFDEVRLWAPTCPAPSAPGRDEVLERQARSAAFLDSCRTAFGVTNANHVKPGIGEATRVLLRRVPHVVLVRDEQHADTAHLLALAEEKSVPVRILPQLPYAAAALIRNVHGH